MKNFIQCSKRIQNFFNENNIHYSKISEEVFNSKGYKNKSFMFDCDYALIHIHKNKKYIKFIPYNDKIGCELFLNIDEVMHHLEKEKTKRSKLWQA